MCSDQETYHLLCERAVTIQKGGGYSRGEKREIFSSGEQTIEKRMYSSINLARFLSIKASYLKSKE